MELLWNDGAWLNIASGVLMAALGLFLLAANPRKDWNRIFALLAVFWGAQIVALNMVRVTPDAQVARFAGEVGLAFAVPLYFFFATFADIFPRPKAPFGTSNLAIALLSLPAAAALVTLFLRPELLIASIAAGNAPDAHRLQWGPLLPYLVVGPQFGAMLYALFVMTRRLGEAASSIERKQITFVLAALALFVGYNTPTQLLLFASTVFRGTPSEAAAAEAALITAIMLLTLAMLAVLGRQLARRTAAGTAEEQGEARTVLAVLAGATAAAVLVWALAQLSVQRLDVLGLVRSASVALIVYAIVRYQLFDIDLRVKHAGATATAVLAGLAIAGVLWLVLQQVRIPVTTGGVVSLVVALVAFVPLLRVTSHVADRLAPQVSREGDHLYLRKLEVYRAQVEAVLREGRAAGPREPALVELRGKLGLSERDHGVVVSLAQSRAEPAAAAPDLRPGTVVFGKYEVDSLIAEGGFGRVFLARDRVLGRAVVIKELLARWRGTPEVVRTFLREAQIAGQLAHPNIVAVFAVEQHAQDSYVVMEHCAGGTLAERLAHGSVGEAEAVRIARGVLGALEAAHARGVVHRDVKPDNVLFDARGEVKLADFGIAQLAEEDQQRTISGLTSRGFQPGTLQFMSPEQARGRGVDARSDVYAVGALLHRMLTGKGHLDLAGLDELAARSRIAAAAPPGDVPGADPALAAAVRRALQPDPADRFPSAGEFRAALEATRAVERRPRRG